MTTTATQTLPLRTYVDGNQEWPDETIEAPAGADLETVCREAAEVAIENTEWATMPSVVTCVIPAAEDDPDKYELARVSVTLAND